MIMPRGQQLLLPVNPGFITASLLLALAINLLPLGPMVWMPDALILALAFWGVHQPWRVGMGIGFVLGLCMDVHQSSLLGQHALAYTVLTDETADVLAGDLVVDSVGSPGVAATGDAHGVRWLVLLAGVGALVVTLAWRRRGKRGAA